MLLLPLGVAGVLALVAAAEDGQVFLAPSNASSRRNASIPSSARVPSNVGGAERQHLRVVHGMAGVEQAGAQIQPGGTVRVFGLGSSNMIWETWLDQLHMLLSRLGYSTPLVDAQYLPNVTRPASKATCDDDAEFSKLHTLRIAIPGWSSWGFAYESMADCDSEGFRDVLGYNLSCTNGWQCRPELTGPDAVVAPSDVARIAKNSDITVVSNWVNDFTMRFQGNECFRGKFPGLDDVSLTVHSLKLLIQQIHVENPKVVVVVMAKYPGAAGKKVGSDPSALNDAVRRGLADEPNTVFADFTFPVDSDMFQLRRSGHPNCRGDKIMATAVVEALFHAGVLARGVAVDDDDADGCLAKSDCDGLSSPCCQRSAFCTPQGAACVAYSPGED
mmetsp:Transcript_32908/g.86938  ORF Transcript_32908/g.86938 Transcript_32908/m.86938 type:complete len:388 (+) Transcript_32908:117-1280(+)